MSQRHPILLLWLGYLVFVIYGSLVPLQFVARPFPEALEAFQHIPFLRLGIESRADWVANGVLYVPVGFLTAFLLASRFACSRAMAALLAIGFGCALAVGVEFTQLWFPQRTVSLNDIMAECVGTLMGAALAAQLREWFRGVLASFANLATSGQLRLLLQAYAAWYVIFALFPFDLLVSWREIERKAASDALGWWLAAESNSAATVFKLMLEVALTVPLGWLLAYQDKRKTTSKTQAGVYGMLLGVVIELAQFFIASGQSQGASVITRMVGMQLGVVSWQNRAHLIQKLRSLSRSTRWLAFAAYLLLLFAANNWFANHWFTGESVASKFEAVRFLPFYYHYFTTEAKALVSLVSVVLMYAPIGLLIWLSMRGPKAALWTAACLALIVETGKLFIQGVHPDPTNILLGGLSAWSVCKLAEYLYTAGKRRSVSKSDALQGEVVAALPIAQGRAAKAGEHVGRNVAHPAEQDQAESTRDLVHVAKPRRLNMLSGVVVVVCAALAAVSIANFPSANGLIAAVILLAAAIVWWVPVAIFVVVPTLMPVFDLAPWTGRFYFDEFDLLLLVLVPIAFTRTPKRTQRSSHDAALIVSVGLLCLSYAVSTVIALWPFQATDINSFANYYSPYNALRITRGLMWAVCLILLARTMRRVGWNTRHHFAVGMSVGLLLTVLAVLWERVTITHLLDFNADYRATALFSAIHTGGAYIECFIAATAPFLLLWVIKARSLWLRIAALGLLAASAYAMLVTYSRNGYTALAAGLLVLTVFVMLQKQTKTLTRILPIVVLCGIAVLVLPMYQGGFAQKRMGMLNQDVGVRTSHWQEVLSMRDDTALVQLFGMGVGRMPETSFWRSHDAHRPASYRLLQDNTLDQNFIRLTPGESMYIEQFVDVQPGNTLQLKLKLRSHTPQARVDVPLCAKWMLASSQCAWTKLALGDEVDVWKPLELTVPTNNLVHQKRLFTQPIKLSLYNPNEAAEIDVTDVQLISPTGQQLVSNGNFAKGMDHWFFATDSHLQWHAKSLPVAVLFDQGWLGILAWLAFVAFALKRSIRAALQNDLLAAAVCASLTAVLVVGVFDTVIDAPRFLMLTVLLGGLASFRVRAVSSKLSIATSLGEVRSS